MTVKYTFFVGVNDKDTKTQLIDTLTAARIIERVFINNGVEGATITTGRGIYTHENGAIVTEETLIIQVFEFGEPVPVKEVCNDLKAMLNQESIAVEKRSTNSALY